jgi:hypothetical protein
MRLAIVQTNRRIPFDFSGTAEIFELDFFEGKIFSVIKNNFVGSTKFWRL